MILAKFGMGANDFQSEHEITDNPLICIMEIALGGESRWL